MLISSPNVFIAAVIEDLVVLDVFDDSYQVMRGAAMIRGRGIPLAGSSMDIHPDAAKQLIASGCCIEGEAEERSELAEEPILAINRTATQPTLADMLTLVLAIILAAWRGRRARTCRSFSGTRSADGPSLAPGILDDALARLRAARLLVPTPRRCLPASLVAAAFLELRGIDSEIVFGVRGNPFAAHCWVERNGTVLDDEIDRVRAFTPIAVGRP